LWILASILALALVAGWGFLKQSRLRAEASRPPASASAQPFAAPPEGASPVETAPSGETSSAPPGGSSTPPATTQILSTSAEVTPPQLGGGPHNRVFNVPPRLERLKEAARANLQFVENTHEITLDGRLKVKGTVYNAGLAPASEIKVRITLTDSDGNAIAHGDAPLSPPFLSGQQSGSFEVLFPDPHRPISIKAELSWNS
jgi:hypothetical protein